MSTNIEKTVGVAWEDFYKHMGYLYYGIAAVNGPVSADDAELLRKTVNRIWDRDAKTLVGFEGYTPNKIESLFDWLGLNETDAGFCFDAFNAYFNKIQDELNPEMKNWLQKSALEVARIFRAEENATLQDIQNRLS